MPNDGSIDVGAVVLPSRVISYDPIKQEVVDPYSKDNSILTGFKGENFIETGTVYAPYIPMYSTAHNASVNAYGYIIECPGDGVNRYIYDPSRDGDINALDHIEENGLVILDDNEEEHYIDAIDPNTLVENIKRGGPPKLKATWTEEIDQDLQAMYGINVEKSLQKYLTKRIKEEYYGKQTICGTPS